MWIFLDNNSR